MLGSEKAQMADIYKSCLGTVVTIQAWTSA